MGDLFVIMFLSMTTGIIAAAILWYLFAAIAFSVMWTWGFLSDNSDHFT